MQLTRHTLTAGDTRVEVLPHLGAKVVSLRRAGHEWLAPPARPLALVTADPGAWGDHDCSGWDECFPNIAADPARGLADHGVAWSSAWEVRAAGPTTLEAVLATDRWRFGRRLALSPDGGRLTASYRVEVTEALAWAWAQHPLLVADVRTRVQLPHDCDVRVEAAFDRGRQVDDIGWLAPGGVLGADTVLSGAAGRAAKVWFTEPPAWVRVVRDGRSVTWRLDRSSSPHAGLWVNLGGWDAGTDAPLGHVAVEPAYGARDGFAEAQGSGAGPRLEAGESHTWQVVVNLDHSE